MVNKPRVLLSHSGVQHAYKVGRALHSAGLLIQFYSTLYYQPKLPIYKVGEKIFGGYSWFTAMKERRYDPKLPIEVIHSVPWLEIGYQIWQKLSRSRWEHSALTLKNDLFDRYVSKKLRRFRECFDLFYGFSGCALHCLKQSKSLGKLSILDHHDIHHQTAKKLLQEEIELHPDFAETIPYWPPYEPYLQRVEAEDCAADYHMVLSSFAKNSYVHAGMNPEKISIVPLGVDLDRFSSDMKQENNHKFRILFVGAIGQRKGIKYLLESFKHLALPNSELVLAGNVLGRRKALEKYSHLFHLEQFIEPSLMPSFYRSGEVFVLPSVYDSFGQVIVEAMACGLPVIVSENTAGHDIVRDGVDGFVIPIRDVNALSVKLLILYENPELRQWMGENARKRAQEFSLEEYSQKLVDILLTVWEKNNQSTSLRANVVSEAI